MTVISPAPATDPISTGKAPGMAPMATDKVVYLFSGVYKNAYKITEIIHNKLVNGLIIDNKIEPVNNNNPAKNTASEIFILPAASGRCDVRVINLSKSFSNT